MLWATWGKWTAETVSFHAYCVNFVFANRVKSQPFSIIYDTGNESVPKIIINNTINLFLKLQSAFSYCQTITVTSECCLTKLLPYILFEKHISIGNWWSACYGFMCYQTTSCLSFFLEYLPVFNFSYCCYYDTVGIWQCWLSVCRLMNSTQKNR